MDKLQNSCAPWPGSPFLKKGGKVFFLVMASNDRLLDDRLEPSLKPPRFVLVPWKPRRWPVVPVGCKVSWRRIKEKAGKSFALKEKVASLNCKQRKVNFPLAEKARLDAE